MNRLYMIDNKVMSTSILCDKCAQSEGLNLADGENSAGFSCELCGINDNSMPKNARNMKMFVSTGMDRVSSHGMIYYEQRFEKCCVHVQNKDKCVSIAFDVRPIDTCADMGHFSIYTFSLDQDCHTINKDGEQYGAAGKITGLTAGEDLLFALADLYGYTVKEKDDRRTL